MILVSEEKESSRYPAITSILKEKGLKMTRKG